MNQRTAYLAVLCGVAGVILSAGAGCLRRDAEPSGEVTSVDRPCRISPDYADVVLPPNIAPVNFVVKEPGTRYRVKVSSGKGRPIEIADASGEIVIPMGPWRKLLEANRGGKVIFEVTVKQSDGTWCRFSPITNTIANEEIDPYLVYREMPVYNLVWTDMGVYQRNLENYDVRAVLQNSYFSRGCCNCHTFLKGDPDEMLMNVRSSPRSGPLGGLLITTHGRVDRVVNTKTALSPVPAIYLAWHPSGKAVGFSTNKIHQIFHARGDNRLAADSTSDIGVYLIESNMVTTTPEISRPDRLETSPTWDPNGQYLYYCSAPGVPLERYKELLYDLMRIRYEVKTNTWGKPETVLSSARTGLSIAQPQFSPDGTWLLFCMCEFSNFPAYQQTADLYMMDVKTGKYERLAANSDEAESWHAWSSNSRWIVFTSKRSEGYLARPYFSYIDEAGKAHKPLLLPQKDPAFYESYTRIFNLPQLARGRVRLTPRKIVRALHARDRQFKATLDPKVKPRPPERLPDTGPSRFE